MQLDVTERDAGERLDSFLRKKAPIYSRAQWQRLIEQGAVFVNGACRQGSYRVSNADVVTHEKGEAPALVPPEDLPLDVIHQDSSILVINKPAGMIVHPTSAGKTGTLANRLVVMDGPLSSMGGELRPGIVHRLDGTTTGVLVIARTDEVHENLKAQFKARTVKKIYNAVCAGEPDLDGDVIEGNIDRHPKRRNRMTVVREGGRQAKTSYKVVERFRGFALLDVVPHTGRTHQIRVHMRMAGHPLLGDAKYGGPMTRFADLGVTDNIASGKLIKRPALHAYQLSFDHPATGERVTFRCEWPEDFARVVDALRTYRS